MRRYTILIAWLCMLYATGVEELRALPYCQKSVIPVANSLLAYKPRINVCEGLFVRQVAADSRISIIGLHEHRPAFKSGNEGFLSISVNPAVAQKNIALRAVSARYRQYYRMDAIFKPDEIPFQWSRNILNYKDVNIKPDELDVIACEDSCTSQNLDLLPVSVTGDGLGTARALEIVLASNIDISAITIRAVRLSDGRTVINNKEYLHGEQLLAGLVKRISLKELQRGDYRLIITATPLYQEDVMANTQAIVRIP